MSQDDSLAVNDAEKSSQEIFSQNVSALQLISDSILNDELFLLETEDATSMSNFLDTKIKQLYPLAFWYPSIAQTKANASEPIYSLITSDYLKALRKASLVDIEEFCEIKASYLQSENFYSLSNMQQEDIKNYLNTIELCRNTMIETALKISNCTITKCSGAEMRAWSEMAKNMSEDDQDKVVDAFFYAAAGVAGGAAGWVIAGIGLLISWFR